MAQRNEKILKKLIHKYRLVVMDESTLRERSSINLNGFNILLLSSIGLVVFFLLFYLLFRFTPMQSLVVKDTGINMSKEMLVNTDKYLSQMVKRNEISLQREEQLRKILTQEITAESSQFIEDQFLGQKNLEKQPTEAKVDAHHSDANGPAADTQSNLEKSVVRRNNFVLYPPIKGEISRGFDIRAHAAVDVIPNQFDDVHNVLDGIVVFSSWTPDFGHVIALQHNENLISIYKHNAVLFKKVGTFVEAGEPIAVVGNSGELTSGKHLHFELWENGRVVNPTDYINF